MIYGTVRSGTARMQQVKLVFCGKLLFLAECHGVVDDVDPSKSLNGPERRKASDVGERTCVLAEQPLSARCGIAISHGLLKDCTGIRWSRRIECSTQGASPQMQVRCIVYLYGLILAIHSLQRFLCRVTVLFLRQRGSTFARFCR